MKKVVAFQKSLFINGMVYPTKLWFILGVLSGIFADKLLLLAIFLMMNSYIETSSRIQKMFPIKKGFYIGNMFLSGFLMMIIVYVFLTIVSMGIYLIFVLFVNGPSDVMKEFMIEGTFQMNLVGVVLFVSTYLAGTTALICAKKQNVKMGSILCIIGVSTLLYFIQETQPDIFVALGSVIGIVCCVACPWICKKYVW